MAKESTHDKKPPHIKERRRAAGRVFVQLAAAGRVFVQLAAAGSLIGVYVPIGLFIKTAGV
jgi:hypothetical protein